MPEEKSTLIIVESPTKARTIKRFLPENCVVLASCGHIRALPEDSLAIDVEHGYKPKFVIIDGKQKIISQIKAELRKASDLILATDDDREGESISWHLVDVLKPSVPYRRMVFHEITRSAIAEAFKGGREIDLNLVKAQEARRVLDRLYGYTVSPILWKKLSNKKLSAGRVQSPGLRLIVDRERQRLAFKKGFYWGLKARLGCEGGSFEARLARVDGQKVADGKEFDQESGEYLGRKGVVLLDETAAEALRGRLEAASWKVGEVRSKTAFQKPAPPFTTSTLQQEGNIKLRYSAKDTMKIAQSLYEKGFITYMRTDSPSLSKEGTFAARAAAEALYGKDCLPPQPRFYKARSANAQEAHEAIRPAAVNGAFAAPEETGLAGKELSLYRLIFKRAVASQMADARKLTTTVEVEADGALFEASSTAVEFPGFLKVYGVGAGQDEGDGQGEAQGRLPDLEKGAALELLGLEPVSHETKMPVRFTEASLVQTLEKMGIGRPSTYAQIIGRIMEKNYVVKEGNALVPTFFGFAVVQLLESSFGALVDYDFTKNMEGDLDSIASGEIDEVAYLRRFYEGPEGLKALCDSILKAVDSKEAKRIALPGLPEDTPVMVGPYGPYFVSGGAMVSIPDKLVPALLTPEKIEELKASPRGGAAAGPEVVGTDPATGRNVYLCDGRFGPYWQLGEAQGRSKPPRFSVPKGMAGKDVPLETVLKLLSLPTPLGKSPEGKEVSIGAGKFGPYVVCDGEYRSVPGFDVLFGLTLEAALDLLAAPKPASRSRGARQPRASRAPKEALPIVDFGLYEGKPLVLLNGRYGYYLKHGTENHGLPAALRNNEEACRNLGLEEAASYLKPKA